MGIILAIQGAVSQGILWGIMALGIYLTYRILDVADLTVDGSFALGGCLCAALITAGLNPWLSLAAAVLAGMAAGFVTGILHTRCEIPAILAGILTRNKVILISDCDRKLVEEMHMIYAQDMEDALAKAEEIAGRKASVTFLPEGMSAITE